MKPSHTIAILAYNNHQLTAKNLEHLSSLGYAENVLLFDNGSEPSFEKMTNKLGIRYHREKENLYVNPAWNKIFQMENCEYLTLLNNDCYILSPNYFQDILPNMAKNSIGISSCKTKNIYQLKNNNFNTKNYFFFPKETTLINFNNNARRQGWLMTLNLQMYKSLEFLIPDYLKLWYGDDWIWGQFLKHKINTAVYENRYAVHIKSSTISSEKMQEIIAEDNHNLAKYGDWHREISPLIHKRTRLFSRYL